MRPFDQRRGDEDHRLPRSSSRDRPRRSRALPDPNAAFWDALYELRKREQRLTKSAVALEMGISRATLTNYIDDGLIPKGPWEGLKRTP